MSPIFLDTDILLDVFAERKPFYGDAAAVLTLIEERHITGYTSSLNLCKLVLYPPATTLTRSRYHTFTQITCLSQYLSR